MIYITIRHGTAFGTPHNYMQVELGLVSNVGQVKACPKKPMIEPKIETIIAFLGPNLSENKGIHIVDTKVAAAYAVVNRPVFALMDATDN